MQPIGLVKGPADSPLEFKFITPDKNMLKSGEFVYYLLNDKKVICRILKRIPLRSYPNLYLSKPNIQPEKILEVLGISVSEFELFEIKALIIGYFDKKLGFVNPRIPPKPGQQIFLAEADVIQETLMKKKLNEVGSLHIGYLLNRDTEVPITLDTNLVVSEHLCILASTGSGKSYLAGVLAEELLKPYNRAALLILDPHNEYHTLKEIEGLDEFKKDEYVPYVRIYEKGDIKIRLSELEYNELLNLLPNLSEKMEALLNAAYRGLDGKFTSEDLVNKIIEAAENRQDLSAKALIWRIKRYIQDVEIIDDYKHIELSELIKPGQVGILNLSELSDMEQEILVSVLLRRILNARMNAENSRGGENIEYPVFIIIEEAHRFASKDARSFNVLKTILSEGRKFGVGVCLISQRPSKIDSDILSQCMTQIVMRIVNPADQENIRNSVESIGKDLIEELPGLSKGQAIVAGVAINSPILIRVRSRLTSHGGVSKDAAKEWLNWRSETVKIKTSKSKLFWD